VSFNSTWIVTEQIMNTWSTAQIKLLIETRLAFDDLFRDPKYKKVNIGKK